MRWWSAVVYITLYAAVVTESVSESTTGNEIEPETAAFVGNKEPKVIDERQKKNLLNTSLGTSIQIVKSNITEDNDEPLVEANVSVMIPGDVTTRLALENVVIQLLKSRGVQARPVAAPPECIPPHAIDSLKCVNVTLRGLSRGDTTVAVLPVTSVEAFPSWMLQDHSVRELGDIIPRVRRACLATGPNPPHSLLNLDDLNVAAKYNVPDAIIDSIYHRISNKQINKNAFSCGNFTLVPEQCKGSTKCATILTSTDSEACIYAEVIRSYKLYATIQPLGNHLSTITQQLTSNPFITCDWAPEFSDLAKINATTLGPPPCEPPKPCPFETRRLIVFVNKNFTTTPSAIRALVKVHLTSSQVNELTKLADKTSPEIAAKTQLEKNPVIAEAGEARVIVLAPLWSSLESSDVYNEPAISSVVNYAARTMYQLPYGARFNAHTDNDKCHSSQAYKLLMDELLGNQFNSISALAGPTCAGPWEFMASQMYHYGVPMLAFTPKVPHAPPESGKDRRILQLLGAGDAREGPAALGAFATKMGWTRFAALSEHTMHPLLDAFGVTAKFGVNVNLDQNYEQSLQRITQWANQIVKENMHIIYLCVEDARLARAALCAARTAGVTPVAWLMCSRLPPDWLEPSAAGEGCTHEELKEAANGYFFVTPEWAAEWEETTANATLKRNQWENKMRESCKIAATTIASDADRYCEMLRLSPYEVLLYDLLTMWTDALNNLLSQSLVAIDNLHHPKHTASLLKNVTTREFHGLTGSFIWIKTEDAYVRSSALILSQWHADVGVRKVGIWDNGTLRFNKEALRWYTPDKQVPDDGSERCSLQGLANALHADCRTAYIVLSAIVIAVLVISLAGLAFYCKQRAEREYHKRLDALGMKGLLKPAGLDRWEVPRERVVINRKLGTGAFGTVYGGHALLAEDRGWTAVAVKTLKAGASTEEKLDFLSEAEAMKRFDHKNVIRLLGVVTKTEPVCTVMEFMLYGDLKNYLLARRHLAMSNGVEDEGSAGGESDEVSPRRLTSMALDVARALSYLAQLRYVHRDVAARNCLVSARRVVKLADFGMTRLVFENDYYRFSRKGMLPVRWMAPESLALGVFSPASDVWSFGVLLYEIVTFGSLPFQGFSNSEVLTRVKAGHTLDIPPGLKPQLEGLIKSCWQQESKARPTASEIAAFLADAPRLLTPCLDIPLDALPLEADPPWRLPRDQAEARWISWAAPASAATDTTYLSTEGTVPLDTDSFLP